MLTMGLEPGERYVTAGDRDPLGGIAFSIEAGKISSMADGRRFLDAQLVSRAGASMAGLGIRMLLTGWEREERDEFFYYRGDVQLRSIPHLTERYVAMLEHAFELPVRSNAQVFDKLFCECVALCCDPLEIEEKEFAGRVFFGDGAPSETEASMFLVMDLSRGNASFCEKDEAYRRPIVAWLRADYAVGSIQ